jgi:hypothetical protein
VLVASPWKLRSALMSMPVLPKVLPSAPIGIHADAGTLAEAGAGLLAGLGGFLQDHGDHVADAEGAASEVSDTVSALNTPPETPRARGAPAAGRRDRRPGLVSGTRAAQPASSSAASRRRKWRAFHQRAACARYCSMLSAADSTLVFIS